MLRDINFAMVFQRPIVVSHGSTHAALAYWTDQPSPEPPDSCRGCGASDRAFDRRKARTICTYCGRDA